MNHIKEQLAINAIQMVRTLMKARKLNQDKLAKLSNKSRPTISKFLNSDNMTLKTLSTILSALTNSKIEICIRCIICNSLMSWEDVAVELGITEEAYCERHSLYQLKRKTKCG